MAATEIKRNGKIFIYQTTKTRKHEAKAEAKILREKGYAVRIIPKTIRIVQKTTVYYIYKHKHSKK